MKNIIKTSAMIIVVIFLFYGCTVQEKMNTKMFTERLISTMNNEITIGEAFSENGRNIIFFCDKNGMEYVFELLTDDFDNIKKICLVSNNTNKAEIFKYIFGKTVNVYAPNETTEKIIPLLFEKKWNYHTSQWYRYSCIISDEGIFASIENTKLSTQSDAEPTLKQSDIIRP